MILLHASASGVLIALAAPSAISADSFIKKSVSFISFLQKLIFMVAITKGCLFSSRIFYILINFKETGHFQ
jgi:hypothetical protein